tara:strand:+ start:134 stop:418 length:285 start_codon:yes stop_codon:yes gene_type:complete
LILASYYFNEENTQNKKASQFSIKKKGKPFIGIPNLLRYYYLTHFCVTTQHLNIKKSLFIGEALFAVWTGLEPCLASPVAVALLPNIFIYVDDL